MISTTAQPGERLKKINIQETIGAPKGRIFVQLILESLLLAFVSFLLACLFIFIVLPAFNDLTGSSFSVSGIFSFQNLVKYFLLVPFIGVITGIFPSYVLSSRKSSRSAGKINVSGVSRPHSRSLLTVVQFATTIVLMISSLVILEQVKLFTGKQLGFEKEKMIYSFLPVDLGDKKKTLREELMRIPEVEDVASSSLIPGNAGKVVEVMAMLNKDFIKWVVVAFMIATPVAYYAMRKWLENFAYKTSLSWWIFALAGVLALGIALLTVSWQSWKAATRNPVEALRYE
jgi:hypothetical protein